MHNHWLHFFLAGAEKQYCNEEYQSSRQTSHGNAHEDLTPIPKWLDERFVTLTLRQLLTTLFAKTHLISYRRTTEWASSSVHTLVPSVSLRFQLTPLLIMHLLLHDCETSITSPSRADIADTRTMLSQHLALWVNAPNSSKLIIRSLGTSATGCAIIRLKRRTAHCPFTC